MCRNSTLRRLAGYGAASFVFLLATVLAPLPAGANAAGDVHFKKGLQLANQKKWAQAEAEYRKAIALDPKNAVYQTFLADALSAQGKFKEAKGSYTKSDSLKKSPAASTAKKPAPKPIAK